MKRGKGKKERQEEEKEEEKRKKKKKKKKQTRCDHFLEKKQYGFLCVDNLEEDEQFDFQNMLFVVVVGGIEARSMMAQDFEKKTPPNLQYSEPHPPFSPPIPSSPLLPNPSLPPPLLPVWNLQKDQFFVFVHTKNNRVEWFWGCWRRF